MRQIIKSLVLGLILLLNIGFCFAQEHEFCSPYNAQITRMNAINANVLTPKPNLTAMTDEEFKLYPKTWDHYCPACTLKNKDLCQTRPCQEHNIMPGRLYQGIQTKSDSWMKMANDEALISVQNLSGPFGAVIIQIDDDSGKVIRYWKNHNHVREWNDPTAHAEISTIRAATHELGVIDLGHIHKSDSKLPQPGEWSHCVMYSSTEPCAMCMGAIYWSGINTLRFAATRYDASVNGVDFSDKYIYEELARPYNERKHMHVLHSNTDNSLDAFNYYKRTEGKRYGGDWFRRKQ